mmetsp:Transcript_10490/g.30987  ORF Transcript_10490/g.30987 Transcript_10490/m.30987 type:complete len:266 (+) Transcript_10490:189-986(+)
MYKPDAYNLSMSKLKRHAIRRPPSFDVFGAGCGRIISVLRNLSLGEVSVDEPPGTGDGGTQAMPGTTRQIGRARHNARRSCPGCPQIYLLGVASLPKNHPKFPPGDEELIVQSMHRSLGIECRNKSHSAARHARTETSGASSSHVASPPKYKLYSSEGIVPVDRYNVWGWRKRDGVHPFFNAHFALVQLMLNHLCPTTEGQTGAPRARAGTHSQSEAVGEDPDLQPAWAVLRHNVVFGKEYFSPHEVNFSWMPEKRIGHTGAGGI